MIFDTHAHYDDRAFEEDRENVIAQLQGCGIVGVANMGASLEGVQRSQDLAAKYPFFYAGVGVHPDDVGTLNEEKMHWLYSLCSNPKTVAVGEIGLDYHWDVEPREVQKEWFIRQLQMAKETGLPVNIHSRDAAQDTFDVMKKEHAGTTGGIIHCFSSSAQMAAEYVKLGYYIGIGGVVTFKNARALKEVAAVIPLERIVLETDCPYMAPTPHRGKRNTSMYLPLVVQEIASIRGITAEEVEEVTLKNAEDVYHIKIREEA